MTGDGLRRLFQVAQRRLWYFALPILSGLAMNSWRGTAASARARRRTVSAPRASDRASACRPRSDPALGDGAQPHVVHLLEHVLVVVVSPQHVPLERNAPGGITRVQSDPLFKHSPSQLPRR